MNQAVRLIELGNWPFPRGDKPVQPAAWPFPTEEVKEHPAKLQAATEGAKREEMQSLKDSLERGATKLYSLEFAHVRALTEFGGLNSKGGVTVAYRRTGYKGDNVIEVSVALCNPCDVYSRKEGRFCAAMEFASGRYTKLRVPKEYSIPEFLDLVFGFCND